MSEDGVHCRNVWHVLTKLIQFVVFDGSTYVSIDMLVWCNATKLIPQLYKQPTRCNNDRFY